MSVGLPGGTGDLSLQRQLVEHASREARRIADADGDGKVTNKEINNLSPEKVKELHDSVKKAANFDDMIDQNEQALLDTLTPTESKPSGTAGPVQDTVDGHVLDNIKALANTYDAEANSFNFTGLNLKTGADQTSFFSWFNPIAWFATDNQRQVVAQDQSSNPLQDQAVRDIEALVGRSGSANSEMLNQLESLLQNENLSPDQRQAFTNLRDKLVTLKTNPLDVQALQDARSQIRQISTNPQMTATLSSEQYNGFMQLSASVENAYNSSWRSQSYGFDISNQWFTLGTDISSATGNYAQDLANTQTAVSNFRNAVLGSSETPGLLDRIQAAAGDNPETAAALARIRTLTGQLPQPPATVTTATSRTMVELEHEIAKLQNRPADNPLGNRPEMAELMSELQTQKSSLHGPLDWMVDQKETILAEVDYLSQHLDKLLSDTNLPPDVKTKLEAQRDALQTARTALVNDQPLSGLPEPVRNALNTAVRSLQPAGDDEAQKITLEQRLVRGARQEVINSVSVPDRVANIQQSLTGDSRKAIEARLNDPTITAQQKQVLENLLKDPAYLDQLQQMVTEPGLSGPEQEQRKAAIFATEQLLAAAADPDKKMSDLVGATVDGTSGVFDLAENIYQEYHKKAGTDSLANLQKLFQPPDGETKRQDLLQRLQNDPTLPPYLRPPQGALGQLLADPNGLDQIQKMLADPNIDPANQAYLRAGLQATDRLVNTAMSGGDLSGMSTNAMFSQQVPADLIAQMSVLQQVYSQNGGPSQVNDILKATREVEAEHHKNHPGQPISREALAAGLQSKLGPTGGLNSIYRQLEAKSAQVSNLVSLQNEILAKEQQLKQLQSQSSSQTGGTKRSNQQQANSSERAQLERELSALRSQRDRALGSLDSEIASLQSQKTQLEQSLANSSGSTDVSQQAHLDALTSQIQTLQNLRQLASSDSSNLNVQERSTLQQQMGNLAIEASTNQTSITLASTGVPPELTSQIHQTTQTTLSGLTSEVTALTAELDSLRATNPNDPNIGMLTKQIDTRQGLIRFISGEPPYATARERHTAMRNLARDVAAEQTMMLIATLPESERERLLDANNTGGFTALMAQNPPPTLPEIEDWARRNLPGTMSAEITTRNQQFGTQLLAYSHHTNIPGHPHGHNQPAHTPRSGERTGILSGGGAQDAPDGSNTDQTGPTTQVRQVPGSTGHGAGDGTSADVMGHSGSDMSVTNHSPVPGSAGGGASHPDGLPPEMDNLRTSNPQLYDQILSNPRLVDRLWELRDQDRESFNRVITAQGMQNLWQTMESWRQQNDARYEQALGSVDGFMLHGVEASGAGVTDPPVSPSSISPSSVSGAGSAGGSSPSWADVTARYQGNTQALDYLASQVPARLSQFDRDINNLKMINAGYDELAKNLKDNMDAKALGQQPTLETYTGSAADVKATEDSERADKTANELDTEAGAWSDVHGLFAEFQRIFQEFAMDSAKRQLEQAIASGFNNWIGRQHYEKTLDAMEYQQERLEGMSEHTSKMLADAGIQRERIDALTDRMIEFSDLGRNFVQTGHHLSQNA